MSPPSEVAPEALSSWLAPSDGGSLPISDISLLKDEAVSDLRSPDLKTLGMSFSLSRISFSNTSLPCLLMILPFLSIKYPLELTLRPYLSIKLPNLSLSKIGLPTGSISKSPRIFLMLNLVKGKIFGISSSFKAFFSKMILPSLSITLPC